jgi:hypothetical protein
MGEVERNFMNRVEMVPSMGLGLSVDVYTPDLHELVGALRQKGLRIGYLELFKATTRALEGVQRDCAGIPLAFHGEGLWVTQPDFPENPWARAELEETAGQLSMIRSRWMNHECATKQVGGYSFGTYLPPLYTESSAHVVAANIAVVQARLDRIEQEVGGASPLFLLEVPPLTYFSAGSLPIPVYFRAISDRVPCGLVLDIGHVWTIYRYRESHREPSPARFLSNFLDAFPMERVVEIHVAGLARHEAVPEIEGDDRHPLWIDRHAAPIPEVLLEMLDQVLDHPRLVSLRGVALEVDTKPIATTVHEFQDAGCRFSDKINRLLHSPSAAMIPAECLEGKGDEIPPLSDEARADVARQYERYALTVAGLIQPQGTNWNDVMDHPKDLARYTRHYLPHELLHWGGELTDMFPDTCRLLAQAGISLDQFVQWWVRTARSSTGPYDFFLIKIARFLEFVDERAPGLRRDAEREAELLREGYADASLGETAVTERGR